jgi:3'-5' exoribonuclease
MLNIKEIKPSEQICEKLMIYEASLSATAKGASYFRCTVGNATGKIEAVMWNIPASFTLPVVGDIYFIRGLVSTYNGKLQLSISNLLKTDVTGEKLLDYICKVPNAPDTFDIDATIKAVHDAAGTSAKLAAIMDAFSKSEHYILMMQATAACGVHHAGLHGLIKHTIEVVRYAKSIYDSLPQETAKHVNLGILMTGAFFHDIGKVAGYEFQNGAPAMSNAGMLLEHTVLGCMIVQELNNSLEQQEWSTEDERALYALLHCIASHHEELEWGAAVNPVCLEAVIIAQADKLSASLDTVTQAITDRPENSEWTNKVYAQHNRKFTTFA